MTQQKVSIDMYASLIAAAIGTADPATVAVVEDLMREGRSGLDDLTPSRFAVLARQAHGDMRLMDAAGELDHYCTATGLATPAVTADVWCTAFEKRTTPVAGHCPDCGSGDHEAYIDEAAQLVDWDELRAGKQVYDAGRRHHGCCHSLAEVAEHDHAEARQVLRWRLGHGVRGNPSRLADAVLIERDLREAVAIDRMRTAELLNDADSAQIRRWRERHAGVSVLAALATDWEEAEAENVERCSFCGGYGVIECPGHPDEGFCHECGGTTEVICGTCGGYSHPYTAAALAALDRVDARPENAKILRENAR